MFQLKEQIILLQSTLVFIMTMVVLAGTGAPILFQMCFNRDVLTGASFFNGVLVPLVLSLLLVLISFSFDYVVTFKGILLLLIITLTHLSVFCHFLCLTESVYSLVCMLLWCLWSKRIRTFALPVSKTGALPLGYTPKKGQKPTKAYLIAIKINKPRSTSSR